MADHEDRKVGIIGTGKIGQMLLGSFIQSGAVPPEKLFATCATQGTIDKLKNDPTYRGVSFSADNDIVMRSCTVVFVCVKPHQLKDVLKDGIQNGKEPPSERKKLVISVCAGVSLAETKAILGTSRGWTFVRCMPSLACSINKGIMTLFMDHTQEQDGHVKDTLQKLLQSTGKLYWIQEERLMDAATALGASAPAFACIFLEGLADGAVACGLPRDTAYGMASQMLIGTANFVCGDTFTHPGTIKDKICTPGGCTIAGVVHCEESSLRGIAAKAIEKTVLRMGQLSEK